MGIDPQTLRALAEMQRLTGQTRDLRRVQRHAAPLLAEHAHRVRLRRTDRPRQRRGAQARTHGSRRAGASSSTSSSDPGDGESDPEPPPPRPSPVGSRPWRPETDRRLAKRRAALDGLRHVCHALAAAGLPAACTSCERGSA